MELENEKNIFNDLEENEEDGEIAKKLKNKGKKGKRKMKKTKDDRNYANIFEDSNSIVSSEINHEAENTNGLRVENYDLNNEVKSLENIINEEQNYRDDTYCDAIMQDGIMSCAPKIQVIEIEEEINDHLLTEEERNKRKDSLSIIQRVVSQMLNAKLESGAEDEEKLPKDEVIYYNNRALPQDASTYELEKFEKNLLIIFNQENVMGYSKPRLGTEKDVESLKRTFGNFGFEAVCHKDLTKKEIFGELRRFDNMDFTDYGCIAIAVLTHGSRNGLLKAKDTSYSEMEIINHFKVANKPSLVTKPKLLIIQACRGQKSSAGISVAKQKMMKDHDDEVEPYTLPVVSDILVLHSSYVGYQSFRDELQGSWFVQALCDKINELASTHDLESIMTEVKREVAINRSHEEYNRLTFEIDVNKQMPVMTSTLIRKLYLKNHNDEPPASKIPTPLSMPLKSEVLDSSPSPLLPYFGPCACFLDHFNYIRNCLRYFVEEIPEDIAAQNLLEVANTFEDGTEFNTCKQKMLKAICNHLYHNAKSYHYYKFLHFHNS